MTHSDRHLIPSSPDVCLLLGFPLRIKEAECHSDGKALPRVFALCALNVPQSPKMGVGRNGDATGESQVAHWKVHKLWNQASVQILATLVKRARWQPLYKGEPRLK